MADTPTVSVSVSVCQAVLTPAGTVGDIPAKCSTPLLSACICQHLSAQALPISCSLSLTLSLSVISGLQALFMFGFTAARYLRDISLSLFRRVLQLVVIYDSQEKYL